MFGFQALISIDVEGVSGRFFASFFGTGPNGVRLSIIASPFEIISSKNSLSEFGRLVLVVGLKVLLQ